jgi:hypothetical protein
VRLVKKLKKEKMKYFMGFWNLLEFVLLVFAVTVVAMYAFKHILTELAMRALKKAAAGSISLYIIILLL